LGKKSFSFYITFEPEIARWPIKGSKGSYYSLISTKNLSQKLALGVGTSAKMRKPTLVIDVTHKNPNPKLSN